MRRSRVLMSALSAIVVVSGVVALQPSAASAAPQPCTITGTVGDDVLWGTTSDDVICGLGGDDVLIGLRGDDVLRGGSGSDTLSGGPGDDTLLSGQPPMMDKVLNTKVVNSSPYAIDATIYHSRSNCVPKDKIQAAPGQSDTFGVRILIDAGGNWICDRPLEMQVSGQAFGMWMDLIASKVRGCAWREDGQNIPCTGTFTKGDAPGLEAVLTISD